MNITLKHKGYMGSIDVSPEDNCLHGKILFIRDIVTYEGQTVDELKQAFVEAVEDYLATCEELGRESQKPFSGSFNVRVGPELHKAAVEQAYRKDISLNELVKCALEENLAHSPRTYHHEHLHVHSIEVQQAVEHGTSLVESEPSWKISTMTRCPVN
jgi:predicted HicB family RNase H-like nuclease